MVRYTTPTLRLVFDRTLSGVSLVRVTLRRNGVVVSKDITGFDTLKDSVEASFTQAETASFGAGLAAVQAKLLYNDGTVLATEIAEVEILDALDEEELS